MTETPCPTYPWCKITCQHAAVHVAPVALLRDVSVSIRAFGGPVEVTVTAYEPGTTRTAGIPPTALPPAAARTLGQVLVARGRDVELGEALIRAANLAEGGGHAAGALSDAQLDGTACIRCGAAEGWPMIPAGHGPRGQLVECSYHAEIEA